MTNPNVSCSNPLKMETLKQKSGDTHPGNSQYVQSTTDASPPPIKTYLYLVHAHISEEVKQSQSFPPIGLSFDEAAVIARSMLGYGLPFIEREREMGA